MQGRKFSEQSFHFLGKKAIGEDQKKWSKMPMLFEACHKVFLLFLLFFACQDLMGVPGVVRLIINECYVNINDAACFTGPQSMD
jgi:hypothetical protein